MDSVIIQQPIQLCPEHWRQMVEDVNSRAPIEACGLLAGKENKVEKVFTITNSLASPVRFRMSPEEQIKAFLEIEKLHLELLAIYHSHPAGPDHPSPTDLAEFAYPGIRYLIFYPVDEGWSCGCFYIDGQKIIPSDYTLVTS